MSPIEVRPSMLSTTGGATADRLWALLPMVHRQRDAEGSAPGTLRVLIEILAEQAAVVSDDLARLYENLFIETCQPWVVPYIGDLVAAQPLEEIGPRTATPRAWVANTVAYRQRKGTVAALEAAARDVTGWPARVVEGIDVVATTQYLAHLRPGKGTTIDLRDGAALERLGGPFETASRRGDVRMPPAGGAAPADLTLHVWRLPTFSVQRSEARAVTDPSDGRYRFDPTGLDVELFNAPVPMTGMDVRVTERATAAPLGRRRLAAALAEDSLGSPPVIEVRAGAGGAWAEPAELVVADLSEPSHHGPWRRPPGPNQVAVDPVLGRLAFPAGITPAAVEVTYTYAGSPIGAGPYDRSSPDVDAILGAAGFLRVVLPQSPGAPPAGSPPVSGQDLTAALADWGEQPPGTVGVIAVVDSHTYAVGRLDVGVPAGSTLLLAAVDWPSVLAQASDGSGVAPTFDSQRPTLIGQLTVTGGARDLTDEDPPDPGRLVIEGFVLEGALHVAPGDLGRLELHHVTALPGHSPVRVAGRTARGPASAVATNSDLVVLLDTSIAGRVEVDGEGPCVVVAGSILDGTRHVQPVLDAPGCPVDLDRVTVIGDVACQSIRASDTLVDGSVRVQRRQEGYVRYSAISGEALTPRRFRCAYDLERVRPPGLMPQFQSERYGDPGYAVLDDRAAERLRCGSSLASDIGAHGAWLRPQRQANLEAVLREHLRAGLLAGIVPRT